MGKKKSAREVVKQSLNLSMPVETIRRLKMYALLHDVTVSDVVAEIAEAHIREVKQRERKQRERGT